MVPRQGVLVDRDCTLELGYRAMKKYITLGTLVLMVSFPAIAEELKHMKAFGDWEVYVEEDQQGKKLCHALSKPYRTKAFHGVRNLPFVAVTMEGSTYTLSTYPGFTLDHTQPPILSVQDKDFALKVERQGHAITYSDISDVSIFNHIMGSKGNFSIRSYSKYDRVAVDIYTISGLRAALDYMHQNCKD